jgi:hypothetical protein
MDINKMIEVFFKESRESLESLISSVLTSKDGVELLKMRDAFESEKGVKGGCSSCRLRALTSKYKKIIKSLLVSFEGNYNKLKEAQAPSVEIREDVNEKGETKAQNRRRRSKERRRGQA